MPCNPLRNEQVKNLCNQLRAAAPAEAQRLAAMWLAEGRITRDELLNGLDAREETLAEWQRAFPARELR
jgi:hypothetical protein